MTDNNSKTVEDAAHRYAKEVFGEYDPESQSEYDHFVEHLLKFQSSLTPSSSVAKSASVEERAKEYSQKVKMNDGVWLKRDLVRQAWSDGFIAGSESQGREAVDWKAEYEKCVAIINRFNSGAIPPPTSPK